METSNLVEVASKDDRNIAALTHAGGILFGFIPALIVYLLKKDSGSAWLVQQRKEALNFQITVLLAYVVASILSTLLIGILIFPLIFIVNFLLKNSLLIKQPDGAGIIELPQFGVA